MKEARSVTVRRATAEDAKGIAEVITSSAKGGRRLYRPEESAASAAISEDATRLVACLGKRVVGTARYLRHEETIAIEGLDVHPSHRRRGVARKLIDHLVEVGKREGAKRLTIRTVREAGNEAFLRAVGFSTVREEPTAVQAGDEAQSLTSLDMELRVS